MDSLGTGTGVLSEKLAEEASYFSSGTEELPLWLRYAINDLLTLFPDKHRMLKLALRSTR